MKKYLGVKVIMAKPMTRLDYNNYRGWSLPEDEDGSDRGYLVEYVDGGQSNHPDHKGYISWSPQDVFEKAYRETGNLTFGQAIEAMKKGCKVSRSGWNGKGMYVFLHNFGGNSEIGTNDCFVMYTSSGNMQPGWLASQTDMLAEDWMIVDRKTSEELHPRESMK